MAIVLALSLVVLVMFAAFVLDLGAVRADVRASQSLADFGATAAVQVLEDGGTYQEACEEVFAYFLANAEDVSSGAIDCTQFGPLDAAGCADAVAAKRASSGDPTDTFSVDGTAGPYTVRIYMPVPDLHALMTRHGLTTDRAVDGYDECDRVGVEIFRDREHLFAGVGGFDDIRSWADAVALRPHGGDSEEFASLVILDRTRCDALLATGQGLVDVQSFTDPATNKTYKGFIAVDSDGAGTNCDPVQRRPGGSNSGKAVEVQNSVSGCGGPCGVRATGEIFIHAARLGGAAFDECDLDQGTGSSCLDKPVLLDPLPIGGRRVTRAPIDHRYNCQPAGYPTFDAFATPQYPVDPIAACEDGSPEPHIDRLIAAYGGSGVPPGFRTFPTDPSLPPGTTCTVGPSTVITVTAGTHWYVACPQLKVSGELRFEDVDAVVLEGRPEVNQASLDLGSNGAAFEVNSGSGVDDAVFFVRHGGIARAGGAALLLNRTLLYMHEGFIETVGTTAATASFRLESPHGPQDDPVCSGYAEAPPAQCFEDLALWSNGWRWRLRAGTPAFEEFTDHTLKGQGSLDIRGAVFTPNAGRDDSYFELSGQGINELFEAQFIAHRINLSGQGTVLMKPNPYTNTGFPLSGGGLIR